MDDKTRRAMIALAVSRLAISQLAELRALAVRALAEHDRFPEDGGMLAVLKNPELGAAFKTTALLINRTWRGAAQSPGIMERTERIRELAEMREQLDAAYIAAAGTIAETPPAEPAPAQPTVEAAIIRVYQTTVGRSPAAEEIQIWSGHFANGLGFHEFLLGMEASPEAKNIAGSKNVLEDLSDGEFIQSAYELVWGRGCTAWEIEHWVTRLTGGKMGRAEVLAAIFTDASKYYASGAATKAHDGLSCRVMGTGKFVSADDWKQKAREIAAATSKDPDIRYRNRFHIKTEPRFLVTAIASLFKGGDFIEQFMDNITSQSIFDDYCELVIVDADSPENEYETIKRYLGRHKGIKYIRINYQLGIYDAWNVGAKAARGDYLTNTNLDDLRRSDSLELQAGVLDNLPFVDVTYQDFLYTFDPRLSFDEIACFDYESNLPIVTPYNMMDFNSPHNAPMWRKRLHDELGYFNVHYKSAGDYEFWMRCIAAGKCFYKLNDPHVVYYQNPKGLSTRPDTRGIVEANEILKTYGRKLVSDNLTMSFERIARERLRRVPVGLDSGRRDRYGLAHHALRDVARRVKFAPGGGAGS